MCSRTRGACLALVALIPFASAAQCTSSAALNLTANKSPRSVTGVFLPAAACDTVCHPALVTCNAGCLLCADGTAVGLYDAGACSLPVAGTTVTVSGQARLYACSFSVCFPSGGSFPELSACSALVVNQPGAAPPPALSPPPPAGAASGAKSLVLNNRILALTWQLLPASRVAFTVTQRVDRETGTFAALSIAIGTSMAANRVSGEAFATAYVGWLDGNGTGRVASYVMTGKDADSIAPTGELLSNISVTRSAAGRLSFSFTRALAGSGSPASGAVTPAGTPFVWAAFDSWASDGGLLPSDDDEHSSRSRGYTHIDLNTGALVIATPSPPPPSLAPPPIPAGGPVVLNGGAVSLAWVVNTDGSVTFTAVQLARTPGKALAIAIGTSMSKNGQSGESFATAYVGWLAEGVGKVVSYRMSSHSEASVLPTGEVLTGVSVAQGSAGLTFSFTRPAAATGTLPASAIDPATPIPFVWALFSSWGSQDGTLPSAADEHYATSAAAVIVNLASGDTTGLAARVPRAVVAHGLLMALAWGVLFPGGTFAARHLKGLVPGPLFFRVHMGANLVGFGFAVAAFVIIYAFVGGDGGPHFGRLHQKAGLAIFILLFLQPLNGFVRPKPTPAGEKATWKRDAWELLHKNSGRLLIAAAFVCVFTGITLVQESGAARSAVMGGQAAWIIYAVGLAALAVALERRKRRRERSAKEDYAALTDTAAVAPAEA